MLCKLKNLRKKLLDLPRDYKIYFNNGFEKLNNLQVELCSKVYRELIFKLPMTN